MVKDPGFLSFMNEIHGEQERYVEGARWFQTRNSPLRSVAYFSRSSASPRRCPSTPAASGAGRRPPQGGQRPRHPPGGVCLFYQQGYFRQELNADGWQQERYPRLDPHAMALNQVDGARVTVDMAAPAGGPAVAGHDRPGEAVPPRRRRGGNDIAGRNVTDRLYAGDASNRMRQEILLASAGCGP